MTARALIIAAALGLTLVACDGLMNSDSGSAPKRPAATGEAEFEANIMVGRVEVMQEQTHRGLQALGVPLAPAVEHPSDRETYIRLRDAVGRLNELNRAACVGGVASGGLCGRPPYLPQWFAKRPDSPTALRMMAEELQNTMVPLWDAVCAKAKAKTGDEHFCAIE